MVPQRAEHKTVPQKAYIARNCSTNSITGNCSTQSIKRDISERTWAKCRVVVHNITCSLEAFQKYILYYKHFTGHSVKYCKYKKDQIQSK